MIRTILAGAALALAASSAQATTVVATPGTGIRGMMIHYAGQIGQSFTATDTDLDSFGFEFQTFNPGNANTPVTLSILSGAGLSGSVVASRTATLPTEPAYPNDAWYDFDLTGTTLTAGQTYTAVLSTGSTLLGVIYGPDINIYNGQPLGTDAYAGGQMFAANGIFSNDICAQSNSICDLNFRFTASTPAAVPEPASWAMMVSGFGLLGSAMRRRRTAVTFA